MDHGTTAYFEQRARARRRVALLTLGLSLLGLATFLLATTPAFQPTVERAMETARWGYEGPNRYVRRIHLRGIQTRVQTLEQVGDVQERASLRGGAATRRAPDGVPQLMRRFRGAGDADVTLPLRTLSRLANVPVIQSEELVIDRLVRPQYPANLVDRNIEGNVTLQALIDTVGRVVEVEILGGTREPQFEAAAMEAVLQCRFRPFRREGLASEVYAVFRFAFRIY